MSDELKKRVDDERIKRWAAVQIMSNDPDIAKDCHAMAVRVEELTIREAKLTAENEELKSQNERLERKKDDYPNVLAKIFNDLEFVRKTAMEREAKLVEVLEAVDALWSGDEGFEEEKKACESLDWKSPVYGVWMKIRATLSELNIKEAV